MKKKIESLCLAKLRHKDAMCMIVGAFNSFSKWKTYVMGTAL